MSDIGTPQHIAEMLRRAIGKARAMTAEEARQRASALEALEASWRDENRRTQAQGWVAHLRACRTPDKALEALSLPRLSFLDTPAATRVREWMPNPKPFLLLTGETGTGKTTAACGVFRLAVRFETRTGLNLPEWDAHQGLCLSLSELGATAQWDDDFERAKLARTLVLDEVRRRPGEAMPPHVAEKFDEIIRYREHRGKKTVLTTNLSLTVTDEDESLAEREGGEVRHAFARFVGRPSWSRIANNCDVKDCGQRDLRRAEVKP